MLSYKQWKMLNESFGVTLGLASPHNLGLNKSAFGLDEAKMKKSKKKMDVDEADGELTEPGKPSDDPEVVEDDSEISPCGEKKFCKASKKKSVKKSKKKMWSDEDDAATDDLEAGDEAGMEDDDAALEDAEEETGEDLDGDEEEGESEEHQEKIAAKAVPQMSKKKSKKTMQKEAFLDNDEEWMASIKSMLHSDPNQKYDDGFTRYYEDALFTPIDTDNLTQAIRPEPGAGEVGFAPQSKIGS
jgi:hypothetical protein